MKHVWVEVFQTYSCGTFS